MPPFKPDAMILFEPLQPSARLPVGSGHAIQPGDMLEDFEITKVLGLTSFGVVYLTTHGVERPSVALKEYLPAAIAVRTLEGNIELRDPLHHEAFQRGLQSFIGEALALSQFDNPHLLRVASVWEANGTAYRTMPHYVGGSLLAKRFGMKEPPPEAWLLALRDALLSALSALHSAGLAHGQIEPINIFLLDDGRPVLLDFDAVRHAVLSDMHAPHVDAFSDSAKLQQHISADLHAVAAALHFAIGGNWSPPIPGAVQRYEPLAKVLARLNDIGPVPAYSPQFVSAIDATLALDECPQSVAEFRALFEPKPQAAPEAIAPPVAPVAAMVSVSPEPAPPALQPEPELDAAAPARMPRPERRPVPDRPRSEYPLNSSESVLELLAGFDRRPKKEPLDIEPFESPLVPTLTEEAEPALPPLRSSLFDAIDAGDALPYDGVGYKRVNAPLPTARPARRWLGVVLAVIAIMAVMLIALAVIGWKLSA